MFCVCAVVRGVEVRRTLGERVRRLGGPEGRAPWFGGALGDELDCGGLSEEEEGEALLCLAELLLSLPLLEAGLEGLSKVPLALGRGKSPKLLARADVAKQRRSSAGCNCVRSILMGL